MAADSFDDLLRAVARAPAVSIAELDLSGRRLGRFRVRRRLGSGGMGVVYEAWDERLARVVALKVLRAAHMRSAAHRARLREEARRAAAVSHPSIATVFDVDEHEGIGFIALELVVGQPLRALIEQRALSVDDVLDALRRVAAALACAHRAGIVHRDLKPENVMVAASGEVKLLDFGLASAAGAPPARGEAASRGRARPERIGTPGYRAPEQGGDVVDARADVFSFGVVAREMLASVPAGTHSTTARALRALAERCASAAPAARPRDGAELVARLEMLAPPRRSARRLGAPALFGALAATTVAVIVAGMQTERPDLGPSQAAPHAAEAPVADGVPTPRPRSRRLAARVHGESERAPSRDPGALGEESAEALTIIDTEGHAVAIGPDDALREPGATGRVIADVGFGGGAASLEQGGLAAKLPVTLRVDRSGKVVATVDLGALRVRPRPGLSARASAGRERAGSLSAAHEGAAATEAEAEAEVYVEDDKGAVLRLAIRLEPEVRSPSDPIGAAGSSEPEPGRPLATDADGGLGTNPLGKPTVGVGVTVVALDAFDALDALDGQLWTLRLCAGALPESLEVRLDDHGQLVLEGAGAAGPDTLAVVSAGGAILELGRQVSACAGVGAQPAAVEL